MYNPKNDNTMDNKNNNATKLASLAVIFCLVNDLPTDDMFCQIMALTVMAEIHKWYEERGRTLNPETDEIEEDAIKFAFSRLQNLADLAKLKAAVSNEGLSC